MCERVRVIFDRQSESSGCWVAVGGSSFELSRYFSEVVGFDFSAAFIKAANEMKDVGSKTYQSTIEGNITENRVAKVDLRARPFRRGRGRGCATW